MKDGLLFSTNSKCNMKAKIILFFLWFSSISIGYAQVGIGTITPHPSAALEVSSATQGFLAPRHTTTSRDAIVNPATGLLIYNTISNELQVNIGTSGTPNWSAAGIPGPAGATGAIGPQGPAGENGVGGVTTAGTNVTITGSGTVASPYTINATAAPVTASNGLTVSGSNVILGGTLTQATTLAQGANTVTLNGTGNVLLNSGNVGIGTATPSDKLHITGAAGTSGVRLTNLPNAVIGTNAAGQLIDIATEADLGVAINKVFTTAALRSTSDTSSPLEYAATSSQMIFRMRRAAANNNLVLEVRLQNQPTSVDNSVTIYTQRINFGGGVTGLNDATFSFTFTTSNYATWQTIGNIGENQRTSMISLSTSCPNNSTMDNRYLVLYLSRTNGDAGVVNSPKSLVINNYTRRVGD